MNEKEFWKILDKLDWNNEGDDDLVLKPVIKYLSKLKDEEILYVGDEVRDVVSAHKANIAIASVTYGYNTKEYLSSENPTYFIDSLKELSDIVKNS